MTVAGRVGDQLFKFALRVVFVALVTRVSNAMNRSFGVVQCTCLVLSAWVVVYAVVWDAQVAFVSILIHLAGMVLALARLNLRLTARLNGAVIAKVPTCTSKQRQEKGRVNATTHSH